MADSDFVHIHSHTQFSKWDGFTSVKDLVNCAKKMGHSAVGITDHGTVSGVIAFLKECRKPAKSFDEKQRKEWKGNYANGIRPILGMETYQCRNHKFHSTEQQPDKKKGNKHLNIIAKNSVGYENLCTLSQTACLDGYYYNPRVDYELLDKYKEGIIVTSACLSNVINFALSIDKYEEAKKAAGLFQEIFGEDFYLEMMFHGIGKEGKILPDIQKLSKELNIKTIITNDVHYPTKEDAEFQKIVTCMNGGDSIKNPKRRKFPYDEFYFKSTDEMRKVFGHCNQSLLNTLELADKCDYSDIVFVEDGGQMRLPNFPIPKEFKTPHEYMSKLAWEGFKKLGFDKSEIHKQRLERELADIKLAWDTKRYDFSTYFLIHEDIMRYARNNGIEAGIRGSGYGSLLVRCLGISEGIDPIEYSMLWERFLGFETKFIFTEDDFGIKNKHNIISSSIL